MCCVNICAGLFRSGWLLFSKNETVWYRLQCMGHVEATTAAPRAKGPAAHPKIGHPWMKFTSARSRNGQTVTLPRHRAPERQSRRQAPLHKSISQVKSYTSDHTKTMYSVWRFPLRHTPLAWEPPKERCHIVFQGHPSNFKVTRDKTSPILTQIGRLRFIGRSQLSNPSDLPCYHQATSHYLD